jgi:hypothetical protein
MSWLTRRSISALSYAPVTTFGAPAITSTAAFASGSVIAITTMGMSGWARADSRARLWDEPSASSATRVGS